MRTIGIVLSFIGGLIRALAVKMYWGWFAVPVFGVHHLSFIDAYGLYSLAGLLTFAFIGKVDDSADGSVTRGYISIAWPLVSIAFGFALVALRG